MSERRSYPDFRSLDDCIEMFDRFGPHKCPPEFLIPLWEYAKTNGPHGDATTEIQVGDKWFPRIKGSEKHER